MFDFFSNIYPKAVPKKARVEGDFLLVTNKSLKFYYLNPTASFFLMNCNGITTVQNIYQKMKNEFDVAEDILKNDICILIRDLQWKDLIELNGKPFSASA